MRTPQAAVLLLVVMAVFLRGQVFGGDAPEARPPDPAAFVLGAGATLLPQLAAEGGAALVLALPVVGPVAFPVLAEFGREGFWEEEERDVVAAWGEVFFYEASAGGGGGDAAGLFVACVAGTGAALVVVVVVRMLMASAVLSGGVFNEVPFAPAAL